MNSADDRRRRRLLVPISPRPQFPFEAVKAVQDEFVVCAVYALGVVPVGGHLGDLICGKTVAGNEFDQLGQYQTHIRGADVERRILGEAIRFCGDVVAGTLAVKLVEGPLAGLRAFLSWW